MSTEDAEILERITRAVREADALFEKLGGSSRHYVRECLLDALRTAGVAVRVASDADAESEMFLRLLAEAQDFLECAEWKDTENAVCALDLRERIQIVRDQHGHKRPCDATEQPR